MLCICGYMYVRTYVHITCIYMYWVVTCKGSCEVHLYMIACTVYILYMYIRTCIYTVPHTCTYMVTSLQWRYQSSQKVIFGWESTGMELTVCLCHYCMYYVCSSWFLVYTLHNYSRFQTFFNGLISLSFFSLCAGILHVRTYVCIDIAYWMAGDLVHH